VINGSHPITLSVNILADLECQWDDANKGLSTAQEALAKAKKVLARIGPEQQVTKKTVFAGKVVGL
jgi:hypothetical protein